MSDSAEASPLGLYIHIPFCERKCPYCDFNTYAGLSPQFQGTTDALSVEIGRWRDPLAGRVVTSIFIGGGTPTILEGGQLEQLFQSVDKSFQIHAGCEITCEANPGTVDRERFQWLRGLGVNRLSIGVQSFQPTELAFLGRIHDVTDVYRAFDAARSAGFENINLDFMFGLPNQESAAWQDTLTQALGLGPEHLSLYSLIVEPNTPLNHWVESGKVDAPDEDMAAHLYDIALERLAAQYQHYEVSNWARPAPTLPAESLVPAYACQHNLLYWRNQEYVGVGPGAHSHLRRLNGPQPVPAGQIDADKGRWISRRWGNRKAVAGYVNRIKRGEPVEDFCEELSPQTSMGETMMLGLRLVAEGVRFDRFQHLHDRDLRAVFETELARLQKWGLLTIDDERVRLTRPGLLLGNQVFAMFLDDEPDR